MIREIHWLAGLLEGEGSFGFYPKGPGGSLRIWIGMSDQDVIDRVKRITGCKANVFRRVHHGREVKDSFVFAVTGRLAASWMMMIYGLMGARRREAIKSALAEWRKQPTPETRKVLRDSNGQFATGY